MSNDGTGRGEADGDTRRYVLLVGLVSSTLLLSLWLSNAFVLSLGASPDSPPGPGERTTDGIPAPEPTTTAGGTAVEGTPPQATETTAVGETATTTTTDATITVTNELYIVLASVIFVLLLLVAILLLQRTGPKDAVEPEHGRTEVPLVLATIIILFVVILSPETLNVVLEPVGVKLGSENSRYFSPWARNAMGILLMVTFTTVAVSVVWR